jgi:hypothetical protein
MRMKHVGPRTIRVAVLDGAAAAAAALRVTQLPTRPRPLDGVLRACPLHLPRQPSKSMYFRLRPLSDERGQSSSGPQVCGVSRGAMHRMRTGAATW